MHWRLSEASAIGVVGASQIEVAPNAPAQGAHWRTTNSQAAQPAAAWQIAAVRPMTTHSSQPLEVYSRQNDLIVRYGQGPAEQFSYQLDWRLLETPAPFVAAIELWVSIQTNLLDTQPELEIACSAPSGMGWSAFEHQQLGTEHQASVAGETATESQSTEVDRGPAALLCSSLPTAAQRATAQGLWLIEPTDQRHARRCSEDDQAEQRVRLFGHFMEKGVIRRARMRFLLAQASGAKASITQQQVIAAYRDFANSPLPLTA